MADLIPRYYWDACAWIGFINMEAGKLSSLRAIWAEAKARKCELWTSAYSYLEVFKVKNEDGDEISVEQSDARVEAMFGQPHVQVVQVDQIVAKLARDLRRRHEVDGLRHRPDAIHLATAVHFNLDQLHTWDETHLLPLDGKVLRRDGKPLPIVKPDAEFAGGALFRGLPGDDLGPRSSSHSGASP